MTKIKNEKIKFILNCFLLVFTIGIVGEASAATYYVSPSGSGTTCSDAVPCALSYGVNTKASSGDTVIAKAGTYHESLTITKAGVTLQGELDGSSNRLSIIDPYTLVTGWTADGNGVYKKDFAAPTYGINVEKSGVRYNIQRLCQETDGAPISGGPHSSCAAWNTWLRQADTMIDYWVTDLGTNISVNVWDAFETYYTCKNTSPYTCYIRFRGGDNVSALTIYAADAGYYTVKVDASNVTIKNFDIKAKAKGVAIGGLWMTPDSTANNVTVENCRITFGKVKIWIGGGGTGAIIKNNILTDFRYADEYVAVANPLYKRGAWNYSGTYAEKIKYVTYNFEKYRMSPDGDSYVNTGVELHASNVTIDGNTIYNLHNAVDGHAGVVMKNNHVYQISSVGIVFDPDAGILNINNNLFEDINSVIRFQAWNGEENISSNGVNNTTVYMYNNRSYQPLGLGNHILFHYYTEAGNCNGCAVTTPGYAWIYHNSFSGGNRIIGANNTSKYNPNGMNRVYVIDNILSTTMSVQADSVTLGVCDYNWVAGAGGYGNCNSGYNVWNSTNLMWDGRTSPDFSVIASTAINAGLDISQPFTVGGTTYPALTGFSPNYFTGSKPDMGAGESILNTQTCTSFTYSAWSECQPNNTQTRTVTSSSPSGCYGGNPLLTQSCTYNAGTSSHSILKTNSTPIIDGDLGEYDLANSLTFSPSSGGNTVTVRTLWNSEALFLGVNVTDTQLNASVTSRDGSVWDEDSIEWFIDTYNDGGGSTTPNSAFMLPDDYHGIINILNVQYDSRGTTSGTPSGSWNGSWQSAVILNGTNDSNTDNDTGYTIEIKIPWISIGYSSAPTADSLVGMSFAVDDKDASGIASLMSPDITTAFENASKWQQVMLSGTLVIVDTTPPSHPLGLIIQ